jgi:hypothetical protein
MLHSVTVTESGVQPPHSKAASPPKSSRARRSIVAGFRALSFSAIRNHKSEISNLALHRSRVQAVRTLCRAVITAR